jgi:protein translocase SecG subunit
MLSILLVVNTCVAVALVVLILLQKTDPAAGGMFGGAGGTTQTVVRNPLARPTAWLAAAFMILSLAMAVLAKGGGKGEAHGRSEFTCACGSSARHGASCAVKQPNHRG